MLNKKKWQYKNLLDAARHNLVTYIPTKYGKIEKVIDKKIATIEKKSNEIGINLMCS